MRIDGNFEVFVLAVELVLNVLCGTCRARKQEIRDIDIRFIGT